MPRFAQFFFLTVAIVARTASAADVDFRRDVRPILSNHCFACHGPDREQRQGGDEASGGLHFDTRQGAFVDLGGYFAIVPGKPEASQLIERINSTDPDEVMPPPDHPKSLTTQEKQLLVDWIKQGATWKDHWAYILPEGHPAPKTRNTDWPRNLVDAFILTRLEQAGLKPSPQAGRHTLLRRLSFDITGLPPSREEMQAYLSDDSPEAYERAVDRLLESSAYGERMAMRWLDLVRYADSVGYHGDQSVSVSPYRDYVIDAFNDNMRFDRFTREQLAGDLLPDATRDQLIASGYNRLGMMSAEGGVQPKEYLAKYASDRVRNASSVWLGSTVGCAECHDHKFDPFTTRDFYRFASLFADIKEKGLYSGAHASGRWGPQIDVPDKQLPRLLEPIDDQLAQLHETADTHTNELAAAQQQWESQLPAEFTKWHVLKPESAKAQHETELKVLDDGSLLAAGSNPNQNSYTITAKIALENITGFRVEVLPDKSLPNNGPGRAANGNFVMTEFRVSRHSADNEEARPILLQNASATIEQTAAAESAPLDKWSAASAIDGDVNGSSLGWAILPEVGQPNNMVVETTQPIENPKEEEATFSFVIEQNYTGSQHTLGRFRISATTSAYPLKARKNSPPPEDVQKILAVTASERNDEQAETLAAYYRSIAPLLADTRKQIEALDVEKQKVIKANTRTSLITVSVEPRTMRVLARGNWMDETGEVVAPGIPHFLRQIDKQQRADRKDLADWLTARDNPITARVFVNRLWSQFFGMGLSKVLDDLGAQGETPSHPELLDTLAVEFMESGWDIKHMVKLIVMSAAYRQSSLPREELREVDPYNRLLARQSRFRIEAEMVRDNALAVSGLLDRNVGGKSARPYQPAGLYRHLNFPARTYQHDTDSNQYRRGIYTHWQRQFLHPAMKAFDAPPREECTAERPRSNTPLGALVLLNDPSYVEAARVFAANVIEQGPQDTSGRLAWIMQQALSRNPNKNELEILNNLLDAQLEQYRQQPDEAEKLVSTGLSDVPEDIDVAEFAAWTSVIRAVFNMHEFVTRN